MPDESEKSAFNAYEVMRSLGELKGLMSGVASDVGDIKDTQKSDMAEVKASLATHEVRIGALEKTQSKATGGAYALWLIGSGVFVFFSEWLLNKIGIK